MRIAIVGGGAAGFFGALAAAAVDATAQIDLFEAAPHPLQKVRISGGGRCNVTHHCYDPRELAKGYPRGARELLGPFTRFGPRETVAWFEQRGVPLKAEADGRMFPVTDQSSTVVDCLTRAARDAGIHLRLGQNVKSVVAMPDVPALQSPKGPTLEIALSNGSRERYHRVLLATGGSPQGYRLAASLGHSIVPCVPSLFTFNVTDPRLEGLAGISFEKAALTLSGERSKALHQTGPMLVTHWGLSGPAVLKLSAWGARVLAGDRYQASLTVNFLPDLTAARVREELAGFKVTQVRKRVQADRRFGIPSRYWTRLVQHAGIADDTVWSNVSNKALAALVTELTAARFAISGKGVFKEEFVTCGGVTLSEVDFRTLESKLVPGLHLAGEILDIDGITGGFNFQSAWTTGWLAGRALNP